MRWAYIILSWNIPIKTSCRFPVSDSRDFNIYILTVGFTLFLCPFCSNTGNVLKPCFSFPSAKAVVRPSMNKTIIIIIANFNKYKIFLTTKKLMKLVKCPCVHFVCFMSAQHALATLHRRGDRVQECITIYNIYSRGR